MNTDQLAKTLATGLGVDETKMAAALKEVMAASKQAGAPSGQPSEEPASRPSADGNGPGGSAYLTTMAASLAQKLGLDQATVLAALQEAMSTQRTGR